MSALHNRAMHRGPVPKPLWQSGTLIYDNKTEKSSAMLREGIQRLFRHWEQEHGFVEGAAEILLPAGYRP